MAMNRQFGGQQRPIATGFGRIQTLMQIYSAYKGISAKGSGNAQAGASASGAARVNLGETAKPQVTGTGNAQTGLAARGQAGIDLSAYQRPEAKGTGYYAKEMAKEATPGAVGGIGYDPQLRDPAPAHIVAGAIGNYFSYGLAGRSMPYKTFGVVRS